MSSCLDYLNICFAYDIIIIENKLADLLNMIKKDSL